MPERFTVYIDKNDWWVGVYRGPNHWYVCLLPTVVLRLRRKRAFAIDIAAGGAMTEHRRSPN